MTSVQGGDLFDEKTKNVLALMIVGLNTRRFVEFIFDKRTKEISERLFGEMIKKLDNQDDNNMAIAYTAIKNKKVITEEDYQLMCQAIIKTLTSEKAVEYLGGVLEKLEPYFPRK